MITTQASTITPITPAHRRTISRTSLAGPEEAAAQITPAATVELVLPDARGKGSGDGRENVRLGLKLFAKNLDNFDASEHKVRSSRKTNHNLV